MAVEARTMVAVYLVLLVAGTLRAQTTRKRAVVIGIDDYSASQLMAPGRPRVPSRDWSNLDGAVNDAVLMRGLLGAIRGFDPADVVVLTNQHATRAAILQAIESQLVAPAKRGDVLLFFYSGHGSQVRNSRSSETDRLDESLVPADSRLGVPDIRDKELRSAFNRILDRGARLTVILDTCHSGSGARGVPSGLKARRVKPDLRDIADGSTGPRPENRGALVLSATQDFDQAYEIRDEHHTIRGAFTWALARAMRDADPNESASDTFLRARARLRAEMPAQEPVMAGNVAARRDPLLGSRTDRPNGHTTIAVEQVTHNGTYLLEGGWVNGVTEGSELVVRGHDDLRLEVTSLLGIDRSEARVIGGEPREGSRLPAGVLLEVARWAVPARTALRVWIPRGAAGFLPKARALHRKAARRGIRWIEDPTETSPTHLVRWSQGVAELIVHGDVRGATTALAESIPERASLFVQLPVPPALADAIEGKIRDLGVEATSASDSADYILVGRLIRDRAEYAWLRPMVTARNSARSLLPTRTAWLPAAADETPGLLLEDLARLRRVHGWQQLSSPAADGFPYRLAVRRVRDGSLVERGVLHGDERFRLVLRARPYPSGQPFYRRCVYVFVIDSCGRSILLFPQAQGGSVENRLPATQASQPIQQLPEELEVGTEPFVVLAPYGLDTYFLLTTDEPLSSPAILEWDAVRGPHAAPKGPLEELLSEAVSGARGPAEARRVPPGWSIDRMTFESVAP